MLKGKISKFNSREMFKISFFAKISFHKNLKKKKKFQNVVTKIGSHAN